MVGTGKEGVASALSSLGGRKLEQTRAVSTRKLSGRQGDEKYDMEIFLNPMLVCVCDNRFHPQTLFSRACLECTGHVMPEMKFDQQRLPVCFSHPSSLQALCNLDNRVLMLSVGPVK